MKTRTMNVGWMWPLVLAVGVGCGADRVQPADDAVAGGPEISGEATIPGGPTGDPQGGGGDVLLVPDAADVPRIRTLPGGGGNSALLGAVRLRGENPGDITFFGLEVAEVQVIAGGVPLPAAVAGEQGLDLAWTGHAWLLGAFEIPGDASEVEIRVRFADTASFETAGGTEWVDTALPPITFTATRAQLAGNGHAVLHLDLAGSLVSTDEGFVMLPRVTIRY